MKESDRNILLAQFDCNDSLEEYSKTNLKGQGLLKYTECDKCDKLKNLKSKDDAVNKSD